MNKAAMSDSLWLGSQGYQNQFEFYSIEKGNDFITSFEYDNTLSQIFFILDLQEDQYQGTFYSFLNE